MKTQVSYFLTLLLLILGLPVIGGSIINAEDSPDFAFELTAHDRSVQEILTSRLESSSKVAVPTLAHHLLGLCHHYRLDPAFVLSMIQVESDFRVEAVSPMGAIGLMQIMPATAEVIMRDSHLQPNGKVKGIRQALMDPFFNLSLGVAYLAYLRDHYQSMPVFFRVAAYNLGPARVDELLSKRDFKPVMTKKYYEAVQRGFFQFRNYLYVRTQSEG